VVGGASDAPVESTDVLHAIQCCVTREGFETHQGLSPLQALRLFTSDAAFIQFDEERTGTLAAGKRANLVVLDGNPLRVAPDSIASLRVVRTVVGGRTVQKS
jgi:predicted amidohydrolase YtcJ